MDPSIVDAFAARSLGVPMDELLRTRQTRLPPRRGPRVRTVHRGDQGSTLVP